MQLRPSASSGRGGDDDDAVPSRLSGSGLGPCRLLTTPLLAFADDDMVVLRCIIIGRSMMRSFLASELRNGDGPTIELKKNSACCCNWNWEAFEATSCIYIL